MKIAFDLGGVLSKYPDFFREMILVLRDKVEVYCISDINDKQKIVDQLRKNNIAIEENNIYSADYEKYGEMCKAVLCQELKIDCIIDDFVGYLSHDSTLGPAPIRLLVQPNAFLPYWADSWKTDDEFQFGRRIYKK